MEANRDKHAFYGLVAALVAVSALASGLSLAEEPAVRQSSHLMDSTNNLTPEHPGFPNYPGIWGGYRIEGEAVVGFKISRDGRIRRIRTKGYSNRICRRPALRAIKDSSFKPLGPNEMFSAARTCRTYRFRLEPVEPAETE